MVEEVDIRLLKIMPEIFSGWETIPFEAAISGNIGTYIKLKQKQTKNTGRFPVIDQGEEFISGYVDDEKLMFKGELPIIIFGDHTRRIKFIDFPFAVGADGTKILRPKSFLSPKFFYYYLNSLIIKSEGYSRHYKFLRESYVPIPPLLEQHRIVAKIDVLFEKIEINRKRLDKIPTLLKRFRQSVLAAAVGGKLIENWREENNITADWDEKTLRGLSTKLTYGSSQKSDSSGQVPVLRMGNIQDGKIVWDDLKYSSDELEINKYRLEDGDVLFNRTNSPELVGKTAIYRNERPAIYAGYLIRIKTTEKLNPEFLNLCLNTLEAREWCNKVKTDGVSQSNINAQKLAEFVLLTPSVAEQCEIVRRVGQLFAFADKLEARYNKAKTMLDKLPQTILTKAFRGELVPQDTNDEPASALLANKREEVI